MCVFRTLTPKVENNGVQGLLGNKHWYFQNYSSKIVYKEPKFLNKISSQLAQPKLATIQKDSSVPNKDRVQSQQGQLTTSTTTGWLSPEGTSPEREVGAHGRPVTGRMRSWCRHWKLCLKSSWPYTTE